MTEQALVRERCPRCRRDRLDMTTATPSRLEGAAHMLCARCASDEDDQVECYETERLPEILASYGPPNALAH